MHVCGACLHMSIRMLLSDFVLYVCVCACVHVCVCVCVCPICIYPPHTVGQLFQPSTSVSTWPSTIVLHRSPQDRAGKGKVTS